MNQSLANPSGDGVNSVLDSLPPDDGVESWPEAEDTPALEKGRILLLEDDPTLRQIIEDFMAENGYSVVAVQNGGEGVREVLAGDFTLIVCDFMMPGLPGDMFYHAIAKIRPALCKRFIFMTGHQCDAQTLDFIKKVDGFVLEKPFPLTHLLDSIALAEVRVTCQSIFDSDPNNPAAPAAPPTVEGFLADRTACPDEASLARILARAKADPAFRRIMVDIAEPQPEVRASPGNSAFRFAGFAALVALAVGLGMPYLRARDGVNAASAKRLALEAEWAAIEPRFQNAPASRSTVQTAEEHLAAISAGQAEPQWSPALRSVAAHAGPGIALREVRATEHIGDSKMWKLVVTGIATGAAPREVADRYRIALQRDLGPMFRGSLSIRFEQFEDLPDSPSAAPDQRQGTFTIVAMIGLDKPAPAETKSEGGA